MNSKNIFIIMTIISQIFRVTTITQVVVDSEEVQEEEKVIFGAALY